MSIWPKNKSSKGRRDRRRANWKMTAPTLVKCSKCGALMMPHRVCKNCEQTIRKRSFLRTHKAENRVACGSFFVSLEITGICCCFME